MLCYKFVALVFSDDSCEQRATLDPTTRNTPFGETTGGGPALGRGAGMQTGPAPDGFDAAFVPIASPSIQALE